MALSDSKRAVRVTLNNRTNGIMLSSPNNSEFAVIGERSNTIGKQPYSANVAEKKSPARKPGDLAMRVIGGNANTSRTSQQAPIINNAEIISWVSCLPIMIIVPIDNTENVKNAIFLFAGRIATVLITLG